MSGILLSKDGSWRDPSILMTYSYKRPTRLRPGYFLTWPEEIIFDPNGKKLKNLEFLGEIFSKMANPTLIEQKKMIRNETITTLVWVSNEVIFESKREKNQYWSGYRCGRQ